MTGTQVYEVKLGEEFLMSSLFVEAEVALADLALGRLTERENLDVLVGGLGLGYTAVAVLRHKTVATLTVIEALEPVIAWHRQHLLPVSKELVDDARTTLTAQDFFAMVAEGSIATYDAVLLDIDHAPDFVLHESHQGFYSEAGLARMREFVAPGGVFALWSDNPPDDAFTSHLAAVFTTVEAQVVTFDNPLTGGTSANTVYLALR